MGPGPLLVTSPPIAREVRRARSGCILSVLHILDDIQRGLPGARQDRNSARGYRTEAGNAIGGSTACFPLPLLAFTRRKRAQSHTAREAARIKKPQPGTVGVGLHKLPPLSLERTSQRWVGQVSWLAASSYSLHLPKVRNLSGLCRFRSAHSCGAAMGLHHFPWSQAYTMNIPTSDIF